MRNKNKFYLILSFFFFFSFVVITNKNKLTIDDIRGGLKISNVVFSVFKLDRMRILQIQEVVRQDLLESIDFISSNLSFLLAVIAILYPLFNNSNAIPLPIPDDAPIIIALFILIFYQFKYFNISQDHILKNLVLEVTMNLPPHKNYHIL